MVQGDERVYTPIWVAYVTFVILSIICIYMSLLIQFIIFDAGAKSTTGAGVCKGAPPPTTDATSSILTIIAKYTCILLACIIFCMFSLVWASVLQDIITGENIYY